MKNLIVVVALASFPFCAWTQKVILEAKYEVNSTFLKFDRDVDASVSEGVGPVIPSYSIGASVSLSDHVYLKATAGTLDFRQVLNVGWNTESMSHQLLTRFEVEQYYAEFLPEFRLFRQKWMYINAGFGYEHVRSSTEILGYYSVRDGLLVTNRDSPALTGNATFFSWNMGFNPQWKRIGIIAEYGQKRSNYNLQYGPLGKAGTNHVTIKFGVTYSLF